MGCYTVHYGPWASRARSGSFAGSGTRVFRVNRTASIPPSCACAWLRPRWEGVVPVLVLQYLCPCCPLLLLCVYPICSYQRTRAFCLLRVCVSMQRPKKRGIGAMMRARGKERTRVSGGGGVSMQRPRGERVAPSHLPPKEKHERVRRQPTRHHRRVPKYGGTHHQGWAPQPSHTLGGEIQPQSTA